MKRTITELWSGELAPWEKCGAGDPALLELARLIQRHETALKQEPDEQTLKKYGDCVQEYQDRIAELAFCEGFCLASRLLAEALG